ncbi:hypothetical protein ACS0TY_024724 [Phlomoides rotata]
MIKLQLQIMELELLILSLFTLVVSLNTLTTINSATGQNVEVLVRVRLAVDMDSYTGQMGLVCIQMALSEFYAAHHHFETKLLLSHRDSKRDIVGVAAADIPYFQEVIIMAFSCDSCGYRNSEVKPGGPIPDKGKKKIVHVKNVRDLCRDVIKVCN